MSELEKENKRSAYLQGYLDGLECFAWSKDGVQWVGTCGTTLKEAVKLAVEGKTWNFSPPEKEAGAEG